LFRALPPPGIPLATYLRLAIILEEKKVSPTTISRKLVMMLKMLGPIRVKPAHAVVIFGASLALVAAVSIAARDQSTDRKPLAERVQRGDKIATETSPWGSLRWVMNAKLDADSPLTLGIAKINPGQSNPMHKHDNSDEVIYVLSGSCEQRVGEETVVLKAGDTLRIPAGVPHQARAIGKEPCESLVAYNTGDRHFTAVGAKPK
jgi:quercetin dioxygenase-like cupin family protein